MNRQAIFVDEMDRHVFMRYLVAAFRKHGVHLISYTLMPNHFHLQVIVGTLPVGLAMHDLLTRYSLYFNRKYGRVGHLFQNRYYDRPCGDTTDVLAVSRYIHLNPVDACLVSRPGDWKWSSHHELLALKGPYLDLSRLRDVTGLTPEEFRDFYVEHMERVNEADIDGKSINELIRMAAFEAGVDVEGLKKGRRSPDYTAAKRRLVEWGKKVGYSLGELARHLNCTRASLSWLKLHSVSSQVPVP